MPADTDTPRTSGCTAITAVITTVAATAAAVAIATTIAAAGAVDRIAPAARAGPAGAAGAGAPADAKRGESHPLSVSEVGEAIGVDQPRASRLIQQAVESGLVRREADPDDARRTRVALTDDGIRIARGFRGQRREHLSQALADFTPAERTELVRLLTKLADAWPHG
ncbi:MarR family winged helix-turn-helix transcriptional regulator [Microbacterium aurum]